MAGKTIYNPDTLGEPVGPFSRAVRIGDILYIAGTSAITHQTGPIWDRPLTDNFEEQAQLRIAILAMCSRTPAPLGTMFTRRRCS